MSEGAAASPSATPAPDNPQMLGIQDAAKMLGVTMRTLRFYEDKGLIAPHRAGTTRIYSRREMGRMRLILRGKAYPTELTMFLTVLGNGLGEAIDFPYSPVRLVVLMLPADADAELIASVRTAAGLAYTISIVMLFVFITFVRFLGWPLRNGAFNVWVNLPMFDPTGGGDVLHRLRRDAGLNIVLGTLLPFLIPAAIKAASDLINPVSIADSQTLIWTMSAWAFLPASLIMRGVALMRIAALIEEKRRRAYAQANLQAA